MALIRNVNFLTENSGGVRTCIALQLKARRFNRYAKAPHFIIIGIKKGDSTCGSDSDYAPVTPNKDIEAGITDFNL